MQLRGPGSVVSSPVGPGGARLPNGFLAIQTNSNPIFAHFFVDFCSKVRVDESVVVAVITNFLLSANFV